MIESLLWSLEKLNDSRIATAAIPWASPVVAFGDPATAVLATLGINPSDKEFIDNEGNELSGNKRRFETLNSLGIKKWSSIHETQIPLLLQSYSNYFSRNPYDSWFKKIDAIFSDSGISYYFPSNRACHLDLIPFATAEKWGGVI